MSSKFENEDLDLSAEFSVTQILEEFAPTTENTTEHLKSTFVEKEKPSIKVSPPLLEKTPPVPQPQPTPSKVPMPQPNMEETLALEKFKLSNFFPGKEKAKKESSSPEFSHAQQKESPVNSPVEFTEKPSPSTPSTPRPVEPSPPPKSAECPTTSATKDTPIQEEPAPSTGSKAILPDELGATIYKEKQINIKEKIDDKFSQFFSPDRNAEFENSQTITNLKIELEKEVHKRRLHEDYLKLKETRKSKVQSFYVRSPHGEKKKTALEKSLEKENAIPEDTASTPKADLPLLSEDGQDFLSSIAPNKHEKKKKKKEKKNTKQSKDVSILLVIGSVLVALLALYIPFSVAMGYPSIPFTKEVLGTSAIFTFMGVLLFGGILLDAQMFFSATLSLFSRTPMPEGLLSVALLLNLLDCIISSFAPYNPNHLTLASGAGVLFVQATLKLLIKIREIQQHKAYEKMKGQVSSMETISVLQNQRLTAQISSKLVPDNYCIVSHESREMTEKKLTTFFKDGIIHKSFINHCVKSWGVIVCMFLATLALLQDFHTAFSTAATISAFLIPMGLFHTLPLFYVKNYKNWEKRNVFIPNYPTILSLEKSNCFVVNDSYLFPKNSISLYGIKTFGGERIDTIIVYLASIFTKNKSSLADVFSEVIEHNDDFLLPVEEFKYENAMGYSALINGDIVLVGNRNLLINHSVSVLKQEVENTYTSDNKSLMYVAINNKVVATFVLQYQADFRVKKELQQLLKRDIALSVRVSNPCITPQMIHSLYEYPSEGAVLINSEILAEMNEDANQQPLDTCILFDGNLRTYFSIVLQSKKMGKLLCSSLKIQFLLSMLFAFGFFTLQIALQATMFTSGVFFLLQSIFVVLGILPLFISSKK